MVCASGVKFGEPMRMAASRPFLYDTINLSCMSFVIASRLWLEILSFFFFKSVIAARDLRSQHRLGVDDAEPVGAAEGPCQAV
jgi:hypothetical protein